MSQGRRSSKYLAALTFALLAALGSLASTGTAAYASTGASAVAFGENAHMDLGATFMSEQEEAPVAVVEKGIVQVAAMKWATAALLEDGEVATWGWNEKGELGDGKKGNAVEKKKAAGDKVGWGSWEDYGTPYFIASGVETRSGELTSEHLTGVRQVAAGGTHVIALLESGAVVTWGDNLWGEQGDGVAGFEAHTGENGTTPKEVPAYIGSEGTKEPLEHVELVAASGEDNYAVLDGGEKLLAWGGNLAGQLGIGVPGGTGESGKPEACEGSQGKKNKAGVRYEPCSKYPREVDVPAKVSDGEATIKAVSTFGQAAYVLLSNGEVYAWGENISGQLGDPAIKHSGAEEYQPTPLQVPYFTEHPAAEIAAGDRGALALLADGEVVGWGADEFGQAGVVSSEAANCRKKVRCVTTPTAIPSLAGSTQVADGWNDSFALKEEHVYSFGDDNSGQLGYANGKENEEHVTPKEVVGTGKAASVSPGNTHTVVLLQAGESPPPPLLTLAPTGTDEMKLSWSYNAIAGTTYTLAIGHFDRCAPDKGTLTQTATLSEGEEQWQLGEYTFTEQSPIEETAECSALTGIKTNEYVEAEVVTAPGTTRWIVARL